MKKKVLSLLLVSILTMGLLAGCTEEKPPTPATPTPPAELTTVKVGATAKPHAEILEVIKPIVAEEGIDLSIETFTDYALLNPALKDGQIQANFFQHIPYLEDYNAKNSADLAWVAKVHNEPMGIYSKTQTSLEGLDKGLVVGIPNDTTNGGRALMVLEAAGLIKLKEGAGVNATVNDVIDNPNSFRITMMDAAMLPRALEDTAFCVINSNYALEANLSPVTDSLFMEPKDSPFANVLVVRAADAEDPNIQIIVKALQSQAVYDFLQATYPDSCVPAFDLP